VRRRWADRGSRHPDRNAGQQDRQDGCPEAWVEAGAPGAQ